MVTLSCEQYNNKKNYSHTRNGERAFYGTWQISYRFDFLCKMALYTSRNESIGNGSMRYSLFPFLNKHEVSLEQIRSPKNINSMLKQTLDV